MYPHKDWTALHPYGYNDKMWPWEYEKETTSLLRKTLHRETIKGHTLNSFPTLLKFNKKPRDFTCLGHFSDFSNDKPWEFKMGLTQHKNQGQTRET